MRYATVCSGIEAPSMAWRQLGWEPVFFSEIEPFPCGVLAHHYPDVPNLGDMTQIDGSAWRGKIDLLAGGTPCQSFSVAGLRQSLDDARGNLTLKFVEIYHATEAVWGLWENVPGVLSTRDNAFGCFLAGLVGADTPLVSPLERGRWPGAGMVGGPRARAAWRILDAQYFGLAQRRQRVFVVVGSGPDADPAAVLFEPEGVRGNPAPRREAGSGVAALTASGVGTCGADDNQAQSGHLIAADVATPLTTSPHADNEAQESRLVIMAHGQGGAEISDDGTTPTLTCNHEAPIVVHTLRGEGFDASEAGKRCGTNPKPGDPCHPLAAGAHPPAVAAQMSVRRLIPRECEWLQGFPGGYTLVPYRNKPADRCPDGPRYKALGNSWAVPCGRWIGERIAMVEGVL